MAAPRLDLPTGTVTFLRTDVEGSMRHARALGSRWDELNARQVAAVRAAVTNHGGTTVRTEGDAVFAVFGRAVSAVRAAIDAQTAIATADWPVEAPVRVRLGLHAGEAHLAGDDYGGFDVNRAARIASAGHGGQILLSDPVRALVAADLPPGVSLRDLGRHQLRDVPEPERLFQLDVPGLPTDFPPPRTGGPAVGNLPARLTSFVGRERELAELCGLLDQARLVSIVGPGGIGKSSLAVEAARRCAERFPDGVWFVPLDAVADAALVGATIARALGLYYGPGRSPLDGVAAFMADREALLVLDNFEHLLDAAGDVPSLLRAAPRLTVLVTSRAPLRVAGEQEYPVGPLGGNGAAPAAARLFEERARGVVPGWSADGEATTVEEICRLLDGLPLGIELAAARVGVLPLRVIRDRLAGRLPLPGTAPRDLPARQRTLDGAIAWSYELLTPARQRLLCQLSVFDGGFDVDQASIVRTTPGREDDVLDAIVELTEHSLVEREPLVPALPATSGLRFRMLETIRSFALRALGAAGDADGTRRRHADAFVTLAEQAARHLPGPDQARWLDRLALDHANLASAFRWAIDARETRLAQRFAAASWRYWQLSGQLREGRGLTEAVVDMPGADEPSRERLWSLSGAGGVAYWQGDIERATELYRLELEVAEQIGDLAGEADAAWNLASVRAIGSDLTEARALVARARARFEAVGDKVGAARTEWGRSSVLIEEGRLDEAVELLASLRDQLDRLDDRWYVALVEGNLAWIHALRGELRPALDRALASLRVYHALRDVATTILTLAAIALVGGQTRLVPASDAAVLFAAFEHLCAVHGVRPPAGLEMMVAQATPEDFLASLTEDERAAALVRGRALSVDEAVAYALDVGETALTAMATPPSQRTG